MIEAATESLGAHYKDRLVGCLGDIGCFSFNGNKLITTGGGGMLVTDSEEWAARARYLSIQAKDDPVEYIHGEIRYNYRLTNIQAAMGCAQMEQLSAFILKKSHVADEYARALAPVSGLALLSEASCARSSFWLSTVLIDEAWYHVDARGLSRKL